MGIGFNMQIQGNHSMWPCPTTSKDWARPYLYWNRPFWSCDKSWDAAVPKMQKNRHPEWFCSWVSLQNLQGWNSLKVATGKDWATTSSLFCTNISHENRGLENPWHVKSPSRILFAHNSTSFCWSRPIRSCYICASVSKCQPLWMWDQQVRPSLSQWLQSKETLPDMSYRFCMNLTNWTMVSMNHHQLL